MPCSMHLHPVTVAWIVPYLYIGFGLKKLINVMMNSKPFSSGRFSSVELKISVKETNVSVNCVAVYSLFHVVI